MGEMNERDYPFRYWHMKVPLWKRVYWRLPWVRRRRMKLLADKIAGLYFPKDE